jgi:hypothetical protein
MYGLKELKTKIKTEDNSVECPVKGCLIKVERQIKSFKKDNKYKCPVHNIYISPSTFEYENEKDNLLWKDSIDTHIYNEILKVKRESRIARDNSEDALTWNVFRFLEKHNLLAEFLSNVSNKEIKEVELMLWSFSTNEFQKFSHTNKYNGWTLLNKARLEFGETISRGSEPDIIVLTDKVLYFIEAKLTSSNRTSPSNLINRKSYESGGNNLFQQIFKSNYETVAIKEKKYELMRFWLLGSWMANQLGLDFEFYGLVMNSRDKQLENEFGNHIIETNERKFLRMTWEQINNFIQNTPNSKEKQIINNYFINKTIGYNSNELVKAFNI